MKLPMIIATIKIDLVGKKGFKEVIEAEFKSKNSKYKDTLL